MRVRDILAAMAATALMVGGATPAANAIDELRSTQGSDYSLNDRFGARISACDLESDGNSVYVDFAVWSAPGWYGTKTDTNGSAGGCGDRTGTWTVSAHRVVEDAPGPNYYGPTDYPR